MSHRVAWRIALPMIGLGVVLLGLGVAAAWNVHHQQQVSSDLIAGEVSGVIAIEDLHLEMREIRYQLNLFLRTKQVSHLAEVAKAHERADDALLRAKTLVRHADEARLIHQVEDGYRVCLTGFSHSCSCCRSTPTRSRSPRICSFRRALSGRWSRCPTRR